MSEIILPGASELSAEVIRELDQSHLAFPGASRDGVNVEQIVKKTKEDIAKAKAEQEALAKYKIELHFDRKRSSSGMALNAGCLLIWESGKFFHGGGDNKMYWCGYKDCGKPMSSDNFAYMHVVCPTCHKEQFLDPDSKVKHIEYLQKQNQPMNDIDRLPFVVGERLFRLSNDHIADLLVKTFRELESNCDIYLKFHPLDIRYDPAAAAVNLSDQLSKIRLKRQPLIYPLKRIIMDTNAGADLKGRFLAMLRA